MFWKVHNRTIDLSLRPLVMGVLNVTPDSFSDGGLWMDKSRAVDRGLTMEAEGADILDIGGESSRPGASPVSAEEEMHRVIPVIQELRARTAVCISIDTCKHVVAHAAIEAGADIINDIGGLRSPEMRRIAAKSGCGVIAMHMQGSPSNMQTSPEYEDVVESISQYLGETLDLCRESGIEQDQVALDPGIGFGKTLEHNLEILRNLHRFQIQSRPLVIGVSRKSFLQKLTGERHWATVALSSYAAANGASVVRVHDVLENRRALNMFRSILEACA